MTYLDGNERQAVDCPSCKMQRYNDVDCHHCGNSAVSCLKQQLADQRAENTRLNLLIDQLASGNTTKARD